MPNFGHLSEVRNTFLSKMQQVVILLFITFSLFLDCRGVMAPRKKIKRPNKHCNYSQEALEKALAAVADGKLSLRAASEKYGVPKSTLCDKYKGKHVFSCGRPTVFSEKDEKHIVYGLLTAANWGYPLTNLDVKEVVKMYLDRAGVVEKRFKDNIPGPKWMKLFLKRHKNVLSQRLSENIKRHRAGVSRAIIIEYFRNLEETLKDIPPDNILNYDETNMTDDPGQQKVIVRRGCKHAERVLDTSKSSTSIMFTVSASGKRLPLYVVYKALHLHDTWTRNGPKHTFYNRSVSGWFDSFIFEDWFEKVALPYLKKKEGKKVIIGDNLASHTSVNIISKCLENDILFVLLPANATHLCQPLDVAYFRPLKIAWKKTLLEWKKRHRGVIPKEYFPQLLNEALISISASNEKNIIAGFRACGIVPLNSLEVLKRLPSEHQTADNDTGPEWCQVFGEHLRQARLSDTTPKRQRRKRINVEAGKAIRAEDLNETEKEPSQQEEESSESHEIVIEEPEDDREHLEASNNHNNNNIENEEENVVSLTTNIKVGDFLVCKFIYNKGERSEIQKEFVSKVVTKGTNCYEVSCLRRKETWFIFPDIEDINKISNDQICTLLEQPEIRRGKYYFKQCHTIK